MSGAWSRCSAVQCWSPVVATPAGVPLCLEHRDQVARELGAAVASVVYYVTWDDSRSIKIGTSTRPRLRFKQHAKAVGAAVRLLAVHPGGRAEERVQHGRFGHLLLPGQTEVFRAGVDLREHVASVRHLWPDGESLMDAIESRRPRRQRAATKIRE
jgi:hypothetical protein